MHLCEVVVCMAHEFAPFYPILPPWPGGVGSIFRDTEKYDKSVMQVEGEVVNLYSTGPHDG